MLNQDVQIQLQMCHCVLPIKQPVYILTQALPDDCVPRVEYASDELRCVHVDVNGYAAFLFRHGLTEAQIRSLVIRVRPHFIKEARYDLHKSVALYAPNAISLNMSKYTDDAALNYAFRHETRHHWQYCLKLFAQAKYASWPYEYKPDEVDANNFALQHVDQFVNVAGTLPVLKPPSLRDYWQ